MCLLAQMDLLLFVFCVLLPALKARILSSYYSSVTYHRLWHCFFDPRRHNRTVYLLYILNVVLEKRVLFPVKSQELSHSKTYMDDASPHWGPDTHLTSKRM